VKTARPKDLERYQHLSTLRAQTVDLISHVLLREWHTW